MASDGVHANALVPDQQVGKDIRQVKRFRCVMSPTLQRSTMVGNGIFQFQLNARKKLLIPIIAKFRI